MELFKTFDFVYSEQPQNDLVGGEDLFDYK